MSYCALVTTINNVRKDPNSDRLYLGDCFGEGVIVGPDMRTGDTVLYLPSDGEIERWFGNAFRLFRKNEDGTPQGGYIENNGHIKAIKLRGNESSGIVISLDKIYAEFGDQHWQIGDKVTEINRKTFCKKYIPVQKIHIRCSSSPKNNNKKDISIVYPQFDMHADTEQLAYNLDKFKPGDIINLSLKLNGTSTRHMRTYAELPKGFFRRLFHLPPKTTSAYVCGSRRCIIEDNCGPNEAFRLLHHKELEPYMEPGLEIFAEIVGFYGPGETDTIMPIYDNTKLKDDSFIKEFGKKMIFSYGCKPGESKLYIYRITSNNGQKEWNPTEITAWCNKNNLLHVPYLSTFAFTTPEDLMNRINDYFKDLHDPIDSRHIKEGVVVRILNRPTWKAYKQKTWEFKVLSGIAAENIANALNRSEDVIEEF